ncbi:MAG: PDZ domain-containing protein [Deltaproteobacteria bacterium]|nr:PDZ domain-containing protein [Deltaproteobacteria bacterium]MBW2072966.1 PDZ domain-containing protein [Deltaproteobacteria bacterium]
MKRRWIYDILVLSIVVYFVVDAVMALVGSRVATVPAAIEETGGETTTKQPVPLKPLSYYSVVAERDLFGGGDAGADVGRGGEDIELANIPLALDDLGLRLVGTVVAGGPVESVAIIEDARTRKQGVYHEGDRVKEALIKKILRLSVVVNTGERDEMLTMATPEKGRRAPVSRAPRRSPPRPAPGRTVQLDRDEIESSMQDLNKLMRQVRIRPYMEGRKPAGFLVTNIKPGSIFAKMGLRNGDVIQAVNDEEITSPEQAIDFYESLMEGGEIALQIKRGRRKRELHYEIQ